VQIVDGIGHHVWVSGRSLIQHNLVGPLGTVFFVKLAEHLAAVPFAVGKAVQDGQVLILRQRPQIFEQGFGAIGRR
jgi:hypothetical protein